MSHVGHVKKFFCPLLQHWLGLQSCMLYFQRQVHQLEGIQRKTKESSRNTTCEKKIDLSPLIWHNRCLLTTCMLVVGRYLNNLQTCKKTAVKRRGIFCSPYLLLAWSASSELSLKQKGYDLGTPKRTQYLFHRHRLQHFVRRWAAAAGADWLGRWWLSITGAQIQSWVGLVCLCSERRRCLVLPTPLTASSWCCLAPQSHRAPFYPIPIGWSLSLWLQGHQGGSCHNKACNLSSLWSHNSNTGYALT